VLCASKGRAADEKTCRAEGLDRSGSPRPDECPRGHAQGRLGWQIRFGESQSAGRLDLGTSLAVHPVARRCHTIHSTTRITPVLGCTHCTRSVKPGEDLRAGRWSGFQKTECRDCTRAPVESPTFGIQRPLQPNHKRGEITSQVYQQMYTAEGSGKSATEVLDSESWKRSPQAPLTTAAPRVDTRDAESEVASAEASASLFPVFLEAGGPCRAWWWAREK